MRFSRTGGKNPFLPLSWLFPFLLLSLSALFSRQVVSERMMFTGKDAPSGRPAALLLDISRRPAIGFGFRNLLADLAWFDAVQTAAPKRMTPAAYDRLAALVEAVNNFDPRFTVPYLFGGVILGESPAHAGAALGILDRGMKAHPSEWRMPFYMGYTYYFTLEDPVSGGLALQAAARVPGSPPYLPLLASRMLAEGRQIDTASAFLGEMVRQEGDAGRREVLRGRLVDLETERDLQMIEFAVEAYKEREGEAPSDLPALVEAGLLAEIPREPRGGRYFLAGDGQVRSDRMERRLKGFRKR